MDRKYFWMRSNTSYNGEVDVYYTEPRDWGSWDCQDGDENELHFLAKVASKDDAIRIIGSLEG